MEYLGNSAAYTIFQKKRSHGRASPWISANEGTRPPTRNPTSVPPANPFANPYFVAAANAAAPSAAAASAGDAVDRASRAKGASGAAGSGAGFPETAAATSKSAPAAPRVLKWDTQLGGGQTRLWMERSANPHLWDVTLATDDGCRILASRKDLCVFSEFFSCIFTGLWLQDNKSNVVQVRHVPGAALESIISAYYGCEVMVSEENLAGFLATADQLLFSACTSVCMEYMRASVRPATALHYLGMSEVVGGGCDRGYYVAYIAENIQAVRQATSLAGMTVLQLVAVLDSGRLRVEKEDDVLSCALEWLDGNEKPSDHIPLHLFETLRLDIMDVDALAGLAAHPRVVGSAPCLQAIVAAMVRRDRRVPKILALDHFLRRGAVPTVWKVQRQQLLKEGYQESQPFWFEGAEWGLAVELVDCAAPGNANASATTASERKKGIVVMEQLVKEMQKEMQKGPAAMSSFLVASLICKRTAFKDRPPQQLEYSLNVHYGRPDVAVPVPPLCSCDSVQLQSHPIVRTRTVTMLGAVTSDAKCHAVQRPGAMVQSLVMPMYRLQGLQRSPGKDAAADDCLYFVPLLRGVVTETAV